MMGAMASARACCRKIVRTPMPPGSTASSIDVMSSAASMSCSARPDTTIELLAGSGVTTGTGWPGSALDSSARRTAVATDSASPLCSRNTRTSRVPPLGG